MGTKDISLDDEAYERLDARRRQDEDFSDVVKRLAGEESSQELTDVLSEEQADTVRETIEESRERSRRRSDRIADRIDDVEVETY